MAAENALSHAELFYFVYSIVSLAAIETSRFLFVFFAVFVTMTCACLFLPVQRGLRPLRRHGVNALS